MRTQLENLDEFDYLEFVKFPTQALVIFCPLFGRIRAPHPNNVESRPPQSQALPSHNKNPRYIRQLPFDEEHVWAYSLRKETIIFVLLPSYFSVKPSPSVLISHCVCAAYSIFHELANVEPRAENSIPAVFL